MEDKFKKLQEINPRIKTFNYSKYGMIVNEEFLILKKFLITDKWIEDINKELICGGLK